MNTKKYFDMVIFGAGPAGTRAAFRTTQAGMKTALVESVGPQSLTVNSREGGQRLLFGKSLVARVRS